ncbi:hypothetical protein V1L52_04165 [Treponema sp. HNW]
MRQGLEGAGAAAKQPRPLPSAARNGAERRNPVKPDSAAQKNAGM